MSDKAFSLVVRDWLFAWVIPQIKVVLKEMETNIMSALDEKITKIEGAVTQLGTDLTQEIADLRAAGAAPTDEQLARLDAIAAKLLSMDVEAKAEGNTPPAVA